MTSASHLTVSCAARPAAAKRLRHALSAFLEVLQTSRESTEDILMATGEALANAIEHAYDEDEAVGVVTLAATFNADQRLVIEVADQGRYIEREERAGRSFGLRIIKSIARSVEIDKHGGTSISMTFDF